MPGESIYHYLNYKEYLLDAIRRGPGKGRGMKSALARKMGCQATYVTLVLKGEAHFSLEQAEKLNHFMGHSPAEGHYFMLLIQYARAGSPGLKDYFAGLIDEQRERAAQFAARVRAKESLSAEVKQIYYSAWYYAAIHAVVSIPEYQTAESIGRLLGLSPIVVAEVLKFLVDSGFLKKDGLRYEIGIRQIHLPPDSPLISKHHANWRLLAVDATSRSTRLSDASRLHYSSVVSLSRSDARRIRALLSDRVQEVKKVVSLSSEEVAFCFCVDFFPVGEF